MRKSKKSKSSGKQLEYKQYYEKTPNKPRFSPPIPILYLAIIITLGLFVFLEIFFNGFVWDDQWQIIDVKNSLIIQNIPQLFTHGIVFTYRPLFFANLAIINSLFGLQPFFFHSVNILLHLANTCLIFLIFKHFFSKKLSFIASLFFLVHPMNVEPVANISFMMEPLYVFFGCISVLICIALKRNQLTRISLGCLFLLLSLLSKESGFIFIPIILIYIFLFQKKDFIKNAIACIAVFGLYLYMRIILAGSPIIQSYKIHPYEPIQRLSLPERVINIPAIFTYYIHTFFFPVELAVQQYWVIKKISMTNFYLPVCFLLLIVIAAILLAKRLFDTNKDLLKTYCFFSAWFGIALAFHFQILPLTMTVADRWFYLPMIGLIGIILCVIKMVLPYIQKHLSTIAMISIIVIILTILSIRSLIRTYNWKNNYTLYAHDEKLLHDNYSLENDLGAELLKKEKYNEAEKHIQQSITLAPDWWINWTNLGMYYQGKKDYTHAKKSYEKAITNGNYKTAYIYYAKMLLYSNEPGSTSSAIRIAQKGLTEYPKSSDLWEVVTLANYQLGNKEEAAKDADKAFSLSGNQNYQSLQKAILQEKKFSISQ